MSNDSDGKNSVPKMRRTLAYDTGVLPPEILTEEEKEILHGINDLLKQVHKHSRRSGNESRRRKESVWAKPERDRKNNVIMIDGGRGAGKTSLLLTLLEGWLRPEFFKSIKQQEKEFKEMRKIVRALHPIDFDPLPPDLPIYNWIIQAFHPLVQEVAGKSTVGFMEPSGREEIDDTLSGEYQALHIAAAVGWTTGLLRQELRDIDDFLLWQNEQQLNWQTLQRKWEKFLDRLLQKLENASPSNHDEKLSQGGVIVLPIDDLDLQAKRTSELLLAVRVLRHDRLAYLLTGDREGTDLALKASFHRDFTHEIAEMSDSFQDKIEEFVKVLGPRLREKTIPASQIFKIAGLNIEAIHWRPDSNGGKTLGDVLDVLWVETDTKPKKFSQFLYERSTNDKIKLPFRVLQSFLDRWGGNNTKCGDPEGIAEFLRIAIENPQEEEMTVVLESGEGSNPSGEKSIEISSGPGDVAPSPRQAGVIHTRRTNVQIKWARRWDFVRREENKDGSGNFKFEPAAPQLLLALDLVSWCPSRFVLVNNLRHTLRTLGLVWTEYEGMGVVVPWPMKKVPDCPSKWIKKVVEWNGLLGQYSKNPTEEEIFEAWCAFNSDDPARPLEHHLKANLVAFESDLLGLGPLHKKVREMRGVKTTTEGDAWVERHGRKLGKTSPNRFAPYPQAFTPEHGEPIDDVIPKMRDVVGDSR